MSSNPIHSVLSTSVGIPYDLAAGTDIALQSEIFGVGGQPADTQFAGSGNPLFNRYYFQPNDRPVIMGYTLYSNFADGLVLRGMPIPQIQFYLWWGDSAVLAPMGGDFCLISVPAFNTRLPNQRKMDMVPPSPVPSFNFIYAQMRADYIVRTDTIDPAFDGTKVSISLVLDIEHTYPLIGI
jgi:hypothetical protein